MRKCWRSGLIKAIKKKRDQDDPSRLDLVYSQRNQIMVKYLYLLGYSEHVATEIRHTERKGWKKRDEADKTDRYNNGKAIFDALWEYFGNISWCDMTTAKYMKDMT